MSNAFSEVFRPKLPNQLIGETQVAVANSLLKKVEEGKIIQEILFSGPSGVGKTTIAKMYIQKILGSDVSIEEAIIEMNCSADTGIDYVRSLRDRLNFNPLYFDYSIYFLDEVHGLSKAAQNALLIEIEPLPSNVIMIACTTDPEKLLPTFRSRFTEYRLAIPSTDEFKKKCFWICKKLGQEIQDQTRDEIIGLSRGNVRQFDRYIQQVLDGSYQSVKDQMNDEKSLPYQIFSNNSSVSKLIITARTEKDFVGLSIGLCRYAIRVLENPSTNGTSAKKAKMVLKLFGDGLSRDTSEEVSFISKLVQLHEAING